MTFFSIFSFFGEKNLGVDSSRSGKVTNESLITFTLRKIPEHAEAGKHRSWDEVTSGLSSRPRGGCLKKIPNKKSPNKRSPNKKSPTVDKSISPLNL